MDYIEQQCQMRVFGATSALCDTKNNKTTKNLGEYTVYGGSIMKKYLAQVFGNEDIERLILSFRGVEQTQKEKEKEDYIHRHMLRVLDFNTFMPNDSDYYDRYCLFLGVVYEATHAPFCIYHKSGGTNRFGDRCECDYHWTVWRPIVDEDYDHNVGVDFGSIFRRVHGTEASRVKTWFLRFHNAIQPITRFLCSDSEEYDEKEHRRRDFRRKVENTDELCNVQGLRCVLEHKNILKKLIKAMESDTWRNFAEAVFSNDEKKATRVAMKVDFVRNERTLYKSMIYDLCIRNARGKDDTITLKTIKIFTRDLQFVEEFYDRMTVESKELLNFALHDLKVGRAYGIVRVFHPVDKFEFYSWFTRTASLNKVVEYTTGFEFDDLVKFLDSPMFCSVPLCVEIVRSFIRKDYISTLNLVAALPFKEKLHKMFGTSIEEMYASVNKHWHGKIDFDEPMNFDVDEEHLSMLRSTGEFIDPLSGESVEVAYTNDEDPLMAFFESVRKVLPSYIGRSATYTTLVGLFIGTASAFFFSTKEEMLSFLSEKMPLFKVTAGISLIGLFASFYSLIIKGVAEVYRTGDFRRFFIPSREEDFVSRARNILFSNRLIDSGELSRFDRIHQVEDLIDEGRYMKSPEAVKLTTALCSLYDSDKSYVNASAQRAKPFSLFVVGAPGGGKTVLFNELHRMIAGVENIDLQEELTVNVDINCKFVTKPKANVVSVAINDVPANYDGFSQKDLLGLDIYIQQIIDTFPMFFRAAAVGEKGIPAKPKFLYVTSNDKNFKFEQPAAKCLRRLNGGLITEIFYVDDKGKKIHSKDVEKVPDSEKATRMRFRMLKATSEDALRLQFVDTSLCYTLHEFLRMFMETYQKHTENNVRIMSELLNPVNVCACGASLINHRKEGIYLKIFPHCVIKDVVLTGPIRDTIFKYFCQFMIGFFIGIVYDLWNMVYVTMYYKWLQLQFWRTVGYVEYKAYRIQSSVVETGVAIAARRIYMHQFEPAFKIIAGFSLVALTGYVINYLTKKNIPKEMFLTTKFDVRQPVNTASMETVNHREEMSYSPQEQVDWAKKNRRFIAADLVEKNNVNPVDLMKILKKQTFKIGAGGNFKNNKQFCVVYNNSLLLTNTHFLKEVLCDGNCVLHIDIGSTDGVTWTVNESDIISDGDISFVRHSLPGIWTDLSFNTLKSFIPFQGEGEVLIDGEVYKFPIRNYRSPLLGFTEVCGYTYPRKGVKGECGSPLILHTKAGAVLAGIVMWAAKEIEESGTVAIHQEICKELFSKIDEPITYECVLLTQGFDMDPLHKSSQLRAMEITPYVEVLGTHGVGKKHTTSFKHTMWYDTFHHFLTKTYGPPTKIKGMVDGEYKTPMLHNLSTINIEMADTPDVWPLVEDAICERFVNSFNRNPFKMSPLTFREAFLGCEEVGISGIPLSTSPGAYWTNKKIKSKRDFFTFNEETKLWDCNQELVEKCKKLLLIYMNNDIPVLQVRAVVKDELRSQEKLDDHDARIFATLDVEYNLVAAMYLKPIIEVMGRFRDVFCCYGTINAVSEEWDDLYRTVLKWKDRIEFDDSKFDSRHHAKMIRLAARLFRRIALIIGYSLPAAEIVYLIVVSLTKVLWECDADYFLRYKSLISGHLLTLMINSIINIMRFYYAFIYLGVKNGDPNFHPQSFYDLFRLATVGDDVLASCSPQISAWFHMVSISGIFLKLGYLVTGSDKLKVTKKFIDFDPTFLKRGFIYSPYVGKIVAPLAKDSIIKSLCWEGKVAVTSEMRLADAAENVQREAFLHGGEYFAWMQGQLQVANTQNIRFRYFTIDFLVNEYKTKSFKVWDA